MAGKEDEATKEFDPTPRKLELARKKGRHLAFARLVLVWEKFVLAKAFSLLNVLVRPVMGAVR